MVGLGMSQTAARLTLVPHQPMRVSQWAATRQLAFRLWSQLDPGRCMAGDLSTRLRAAVLQASRDASGRVSLSLALEWCTCRRKFHSGGPEHDQLPAWHFGARAMFGHLWLRETAGLNVNCTLLFAQRCFESTSLFTWLGVWSSGCPALWRCKTHISWGFTLDTIYSYELRWNTGVELLAAKPQVSESIILITKPSLGSLTWETMAETRCLARCETRSAH